MWKTVVVVEVMGDMPVGQLVVQLSGVEPVVGTVGLVEGTEVEPFAAAYEVEVELSVAVPA